MTIKRLPNGDQGPIRTETDDVGVVKGAVATVRPQIDVVLGDITNIIYVESLRLAEKAASRDGLDAKELRTLALLADSLTKISREDRQRAQGDEDAIGKMSDEEIEALLEGQSDD